MPGFKKISLNDTGILVNGPFYIKYGVPVLLTAVVTIIKIYFANYIGFKTPFLLYFGIVIVASRYFGRSPAILVSVLSAVLVNIFFMLPLNGLSISKDELLQVAVYLLECTLLIGMSNALFKAKVIINENDLRFKTLVEKSSEGIITVSASGQITYCSPSIQNIIGYTDQEFKALPPWHLLHEDEALEVKEQYYRFAAHPGRHITMLHRMKHKNGEYIWVESSVTNLLGEQPINAVVTNFTDVSDRILNDKLREDFISIASHELKTPLTSLKAYTQVLQHRFKDTTDETSFNIINKIDIQITKVIHMVTNLLDVTSLQQKRLNLTIGLFNFNTLVLDVLELLHPASKKHEFITQLADVGEIYGDKERLTQVITNLVSNAIKYSPDAESVSISSKVENGSVILSVYDKGIGIAKKDHQRIFARFFRVDNAKEQFQGLGLGLYICAQIIEHHGGEIGVLSEEGRGSTFWFSLPLKA